MGNRTHWLSLIAKHHKEWINIAKVYSCGGYAEDVVQEMYLKIHKYSTADKVITNGKVNKGYIFFALRSIINSYHKEKSKVVKYDIDSVRHLSTCDNQDQIQAFERVSEMIDKESDDWHWYDKQIFDLYRYNKTSIRKLAKETNISSVSIFNTLKNCKAKIKEKFTEDYQDYLNGDYDRI
mgnify:CR=1 FL=1